MIDEYPDDYECEGQMSIEDWEYGGASMEMPEMFGIGFAKRNGDFLERYREISEEDYRSITNKEGWRKELEEAYDAVMPHSIRWGYGYHGCDLCEMDGKYYFVVKTGDIRG